MTLQASLAPTLRTILLTSCVLFTACGPDSRATEYEDEAEAVYLRNADDDGAFGCSVEPGEIEVEVVFNSCGSGCATLEDAECTASINGDTIEVTSYGKVVSEQRPGQACPAVCAVMSVRCDLGDLDEGSYTIVHGDVTQTVTVPGDQTPCF